MTDRRPPLNHHPNGTLKQPAAADERAVMSQWRRTVSGMAGKRGGLPDRPDDPVAYRLLDVAGEAMGRGEWRKGVNILRLVIQDYRTSQEAACARQVIDRLSGRGGSHER